MVFNLFGQKETKEEKQKRDKEMLREWQRNLKSEQRGIDRQIRKIQMEENKVKTEIKKYAKKGRRKYHNLLLSQDGNKEICEER
jgi:hypothetical protein